MNGKGSRVFLIYILLIASMAIFLWLFLNLIQGRTTFFGSAASPGRVDTGNSYLFASPVSARVAGDRIRLTAFVLDGQGKGVSGKSVTIGCLEPLVCQQGQVQSEPVQQTTDNLGQAIWETYANTPGKYTMQASIEGQIIPQTVTIDFR